MGSNTRSDGSQSADVFRNEISRLQRRIDELESANRALGRERTEFQQAAMPSGGTEPNARAVIDSIPGFIAVVDPNGKVKFVNRQLLGYCGVAEEGLRGWDNNGVVYPDDVPHVAEEFGKAVARGTAYEYDMRLRRFDGVYRWFNARGVPMRDAGGQLAGWYVLLTDIDDRKRGEEALREQQRETRLIVDNIAGIVLTFAPGGELLDANQQLLNYSGHTFEEHKRWEKIDFVHPDDMGKVRDSRARRTTSDEPYEYEVRLRRFDGAYRWFLNRVVPLLDRAGRARLWYVLVTDIDARLRAEEDRKLAREALAASERNLKLIVETMPALSWSARPDGLADFFNEHYLRYIGLTAEQAAGSGWTASVHPDDLARLVSVWQSLLPSGVSGEAEARLRRYDGQYRWFLFRASPLRDESGVIVKWYGVNTDIEDRKRAEQALGESEREARLIVDSIPGEVAVLSPGGRIQAINPQLAAYTGKNSEELRDWETDGTLHDEEVPVIRSVVARSLDSGIAYDYECRVRRFDGAYRWFQVRGLPLRDVEGRIVHWYVLLTDIDDRKQAELELRRAYDSFADAQRLSKTGSFITDIVADDHKWSDEAYRIFDFEPGSTVSVLRIRDLVHPGDLEHFDSVIARGAAGERVDFEFRITTPSGTTKHIRGLAHVVESIAGRPLFVGALQDVTGTKLTEETLNKTRSELAHVARVTTLTTLTASIAHEVNQPLSGIITNASTSLKMLSASPPNIEGARETARRTIRDANRAAEIVTRLRNLFGKKSMAAEMVDLGEAAREVLAVSMSEFQRNAITVRSELADNLSPVVGDRVQLQQVILNLLLNASDAMRGIGDRPRRILVRTSVDEAGDTCVSVSDTGVGIAPDALSRLFDAFYTTKPDGMGIGLSVSRAIVEHHGGRIWAAPNDGPGAIFSFSIPRR